MSQLDHREEALVAREKALHDGLLSMELNAKNLEYRESQLLEGVQLLEAQQVQLERIDNDMLEKKLSMAAAQRQALARQAQQCRESVQSWSRGSFHDKADEPKTGLSQSFINQRTSQQQQPRQHSSVVAPVASPLPLPPRTPPYHGSHGGGHSFHNYVPVHYDYDQDAATPTSTTSTSTSSSFGLPPPQRQQPPLPPRSAPSNNTGGGSAWYEQFQATLQASAGARVLHKQALLKDPAVTELLAAQETLQHTRQSLRETSERSLQRRRFLDREEQFLSSLEQARHLDGDR